MLGDTFTNFSSIVPPFKRLGARFVLASMLAALALPAAAAPADDFRRLLDDHWAAAMRANPVYATRLGIRAYDNSLGDLSLAEQDRQAAEAAAFLKRAEAIPAERLSEADRVNRDILMRQLRAQVEANRYPQRAILFSTYSAWHSNFADLPDSVPLFSLADYRSYVARLRAYPALNAQGIATTRVALNGGQVLPCAVLNGFESTITAEIVTDPERSRLWQPFAAPKPAAISDADWTQLKGEARAAIIDGVVPAHRQLAQFFRTEYLPRCQPSVSVSALPQGPDYYRFRVREETTTDLTPDQIHALGLSEVARIKAEMDAVAARAGFPGDRRGFIAKLRTDPQYYAKSPQELMAAASTLAKTIDGEMPRLFGRLPRLPYTLKPVPAATAEGTTTAYYEPGAAEAGKAGVYRVNTSNLSQRPLYELPALTVHEAVPGHHHQIALQQELDLPLFRRHLSFFTAFTEGWGLYSERLGIEMGLYDTPERDMGRLSYEMWRACRLVVDTGIHAKGWTKAQAVDFMTENTALSPKNIDAEVNRYISWPGQALGYKIGELRIRALRADAEKALGPKFDLRAFHDALLENGSIPLDVLETRMRRWIAERAAAPPPA